MDFESSNSLSIESFGTFLKQKREELGLSIRALAMAVNISPVYLSDIEGFNRPAPRKSEVLDDLCKKLNLTEEEQCYFMKASLASRSEDLEKYLKEKPRVCLALRMAQELPDEEVSEQWEKFIKQLIELNNTPK